MLIYNLIAILHTYTKHNTITLYNRNIRHNTPKPIMPVIDSMLAEVGGLGFIGLFLSTIVTGGPLGQIISSLSSNYLNDDELLLQWASA